jgi:predicted DNA-binding helix-hairpin-helix protein
MLIAGNGAQVPLVRENRLYQTDWLMRFMAKPMKFWKKNNPFLDLEVDPKMGWALRNIAISGNYQNAPLEMILRVPGWVKSAHKMYIRRFQNLTMEHLKKLAYR